MSIIPLVSDPIENARTKLAVLANTKPPRIYHGLASDEDAQARADYIKEIHEATCELITVLVKDLNSNLPWPVAILSYGGSMADALGDLVGDIENRIERMREEESEAAS